MRSNLTTQGYCLSEAERRELAFGLRFSTGLCVSLVVVALVLESAAMVFALTGVGLGELSGAIALLLATAAWFAGALTGYLAAWFR
jgi:hypothetical protein